LGDTQKAALTNAENMIKKLVEKVGQLPGKLFTNRPDYRKSHFYAFIFSARRYFKLGTIRCTAVLSVRLSVTLRTYTTGCFKKVAPDIFRLLRLILFA